jgi:Domain of unknown function (DUF4265)
MSARLIGSTSSKRFPKLRTNCPSSSGSTSGAAHRTIHVYVFDAGQSSKQEILDSCNRLGATYEGMDDRMYALDVTPEIDFAPAIEYLESLQDRELMTWRLNEYE